MLRLDFCLSNIRNKSNHRMFGRNFFTTSSEVLLLYGYTEKGAYVWSVTGNFKAFASIDSSLEIEINFQKRKTCVPSQWATCFGFPSYISTMGPTLFFHNLPFLMFRRNSLKYTALWINTG